MAQSVAQFLNRNANVQGLKYSPAAKASAAASQGEKTYNPAAGGARLNALRESIGKANSMGADATLLKSQNVAQKRLAEEESRRAEAQAMQEAQNAKMQKQLDQFNSEARANEEKLRAQTQKPVSTGTNQKFDSSIPPSGSKFRDTIVRGAESLLGTPYAWGGGGFKNKGSRGTGKGTQNVIGVDCSGLTSYAYSLVGMKIPRQSDSQLASGYKTSVNKAQPGDLVGWGPGGHVAVYIGNGMIIESPKPGGKVLKRRLSDNDMRRGVYAVRLRLPGE